MLKLSYDKSIIDKKYKKVINETAVNSIHKVVIKDIAKYLPEDSGKLKDSLKYDSRTGTYTWDTKYAKLLWYGKTKDGKQMKFDKNKNPKAGPRWTERYKADNLDKLKREIIRRSIK